MTLQRLAASSVRQSPPLLRPPTPAHLQAVELYDGVGLVKPQLHAAQEGLADLWRSRLAVWQIRRFGSSGGMAALAVWQVGAQWDEWCSKGQRRGAPRAQCAVCSVQCVLGMSARAGKAVLSCKAAPLGTPWPPAPTPAPPCSPPS